METFLIESWLELMYQRERVTNADRMREDHIRQLLIRIAEGDASDRLPARRRLVAPAIDAPLPAQVAPTKYRRLILPMPDERANLACDKAVSGGGWMIARARE